MMKIPTLVTIRAFVRSRFSGSAGTYHESLEAFWVRVVCATCIGVCVAPLLSLSLLFVSPAVEAVRALSAEEEILPQQNNEYKAKNAATLLKSYEGRVKLIGAIVTEEEGGTPVVVPEPAPDTTPQSNPIQKPVDTGDKPVEIKKEVDARPAEVKPTDVPATPAIQPTPAPLSPDVLRDLLPPPAPIVVPPAVDGGV